MLALAPEMGPPGLLWPPAGHPVTFLEFAKRCGNLKSPEIGYALDLKGNLKGTSKEPQKTSNLQR